MRRHPLHLPGVAFGLLTIAVPAQDSRHQPTELALGEQLRRTGSLRDLRGNRRSLADFRGYRAFVLAFLGTEGPLAALYAPRLVELEETYRARKVKFIGVFSNAGDEAVEIAAYGDEQGLGFLLVRDRGQRLADRLGIERTPGVVVLDADRVVRYRGRIDDQYAGQNAVGARRPAAESRDLAHALDEVLAGVAVSTPETVSGGRLLDRDPVAPSAGDVTFTADVAPILQRRCQACHRPGQIGPFSLLTYEDASRRRRMIREVVQQRRMPPWQADPRHGVFANDRSMTRQEIDVLGAWVARGSPRGDPADMPPPIDWPDGWGTEPDVVLSIPEVIDVPAQGVMDYVNVIVETGFDDDVWVRSAEIRPGDPRVLHHVGVFIQAPGVREAAFRRGTRTLVNWVPGAGVKTNPAGTATRVPKGAVLFIQLHYTPNGVATRDRTSVGLVLAKEPPERETRMEAFEVFGFAIPPGAEHHVHQDTLRFRAAVRVLSFRPHMHLRGKGWKYEAIYPDGRTRPLLSVPAWDFNWQTEYFFAEPLLMPEGSRIRATAVWDNSDNNLLNPDPTKRVVYGEQTFEEMMNGWMKYVPERAGDTSRLVERESRTSDYARYAFGLLDKDGDGELSSAEWQKSERTRPWFERRGIELELPAGMEAFVAAYPRRR